MSPKFLTLIFIILVSIQLSSAVWPWFSKSETPQAASTSAASIESDLHAKEPMNDLNNELPASQSTVVSTEETVSVSSPTTNSATTTTGKKLNSTSISIHESRDTYGKGEDESADASEESSTIFNFSESTPVNFSYVASDYDQSNKSTSLSEEIVKEDKDDSTIARSISNNSENYDEPAPASDLGEQNSPSPDPSEIANPTLLSTSPTNLTESHNITTTVTTPVTEVISSNVTKNQMEISTTQSSIIKNTESLNTSIDTTTSTEVQNLSSTTVTENQTAANATHVPRSVMNDTESYNEASEIGAKAVSRSASIALSKSALSFLFFWVIFLF